MNAIRGKAVDGWWQNFLSRVTRGVLLGVSVAVIFSIVAGIVTILSLGAATRKLGLSYPNLVMLYFAGGSSAGAIYGAAWPLAKRNPVLAFLVGTIALLPFAIGYVMLAMPHTEWLWAGITVAGIGAVLLGGLSGLMIAGWADLR